MEGNQRIDRIIELGSLKFWCCPAGQGRSLSYSLFTRLIPAYGFGVTHLSVQPNLRIVRSLGTKAGGRGNSIVLIIHSLDPTLQLL